MTEQTLPTITHISSKEQFQQELAHTGVTVIDFYADWCGPCKMLAPLLDQLQAENSEKGVKILKINIDENPDLAAEFDVTTIPTVFFALNGEIKEGVVGVNPKDFYQGKIDEYRNISSVE
jgi:thioredoxin 1